MARDWSDNPVFSRISMIDAVVSLLGFSLTALTGWGEEIPWTYRIPAALATAAFALWIWRHLSLRRLLVPNKLQSVYENDCIIIGDLFQGRSIIRNVTFKNVELVGPGAIYFENNCRFVGTRLFNPDFDQLKIVPLGYVSIEPFFRMSGCTFEDVIITRIGIFISKENQHLFGLKIEIPNKDEEPISEGEVSGNQPPQDTGEEMQP